MEEDSDLRVFIKLPLEDPAAVEEQVLRLGGIEIIHFPVSERVRRLIIIRE